MTNRLGALAFLLLLLTGCPPSGGTGPARADDLAALKARGKLVVAMDVGYDPFEVRDKDGKIVGFDCDLAAEIGKDLGVEVELLNVAWDGIIPHLTSGKVDVILSGMSITAERQKTVTFSDPYYEVGQVVVKKKGDGRIRSFKDLDQPDLRIATQMGTTGEKAIRDFMPRACPPSPVLFEKVDEACVALVQGKADAVVFDHPFLMRYMQEKSEGLEGIWEPFTKEPIGAAVRQTSAELVASINKTIERLRASGEMPKLEAKWFPARPGAPAGAGQ